MSYTYFMESIRILKIHQLPYDELQPFQLESQKEGFQLINKLITEYDNGTNRFDKPGEVLFSVIFQKTMVGIGGLNKDPYLSDNFTGRIRHVYVLNQYRRLGIGSYLIKRIIKEARLSFNLLTLRTKSKTGSLFYENLGFQKTTTLIGATHFLDLK